MLTSNTTLVAHELWDEALPLFVLIFVIYIGVYITLVCVCVYFTDAGKTRVIQFFC